MEDNNKRTAKTRGRDAAERTNQQREKGRKNKIYPPSLFLLSSSSSSLLMTTPTPPPLAAMRNEDALSGKGGKNERERNPGPLHHWPSEQSQSTASSRSLSPIRAQPFFPIFSRLFPPFIPPPIQKLGAPNEHLRPMPSESQHGLNRNQLPRPPLFF